MEDIDQPRGPYWWWRPLSWVPRFVRFGSGADPVLTAFENADVPDAGDDCLEQTLRQVRSLANSLGLIYPPEEDRPGSPSSSGSPTSRAFLADVVRMNILGEASEIEHESVIEQPFADSDSESDRDLAYYVRRLPSSPLTTATSRLATIEWDHELGVPSASLANKIFHGTMQRWTNLTRDVQRWSETIIVNENGVECESEHNLKPLCGNEAAIRVAYTTTALWMTDRIAAALAWDDGHKWTDAHLVRVPTTGTSRNLGQPDFVLRAPSKKAVVVGEAKCLSGVLFEELLDNHYNGSSSDFRRLIGRINAHDQPQVVYLDHRLGG
ncbi:Tlg2-vesicle protein [Ascosphaera pollenicola]|nr:Tlg2-vesicle protein [Ascosphaera pollenicola]